MGNYFWELILKPFTERTT